MPAWITDLFVGLYGLVLGLPDTIRHSPFAFAVFVILAGFALAAAINGFGIIARENAADRRAARRHDNR
jgi:hypothetical protein